MPAISFHYPFILYSLVFFLVLLFVFYRRALRIRREKLLRFSLMVFTRGNLTNHNHTLFLLKIIFIFASFIFLSVALAGPRWGETTQEVSSKGVDIIFALDTSKSMLAQDIKPNRLERTKLALEDLIQSLAGDRVGLIAFSGRAFLECPLTVDYDAFLASLAACNTDIIAEGGTDFASAIDEASKILSSEDSHKILVLISDGEDLENAGQNRAIQAKANGITIHAIGVGTPQGDIVPIRKPDGSLDYVKDQNGNIVKTKLEETTLKRMAEITGGLYSPLGPKGEGLEYIYNAILQTTSSTETFSTIKTLPIERFFIPTMLCFLLLVIELLIPTYKKSRACSSPIQTKSIHSTALLFVFFTLFTSKCLARDDLGLNAYKDKNYDKALQFYEKKLHKESQANTSILQYNLGCTLYQKNDYEGAKNAFEKSLQTEDTNLQAKIFYNLGNTLVAYSNTLDNDSSLSIEKLKGAIQAYENSLDIVPNNPKAIHNLELAKKKLEELEKQEKAKPPASQDNPPKTDEDSKEEQKPSPTPSSSSPNQEEKSNPQSMEGKPENNSQNQPFPGQKLTKEEAKALLDLSKKEEAKLHLPGLGSTGVPAPSSFKNIRDW